MEYNNVPTLSELVYDMVNISQNQRQNGQMINIDLCPLYFTMN